jgi:hypothetical protein
MMIPDDGTCHVSIHDHCTGDTEWVRPLREWNAAMAQGEVQVDAGVATAHPQLARRAKTGELGAALNDYPCGGDRVVSQV